MLTKSTKMLMWVIIKVVIIVKRISEYVHTGIIDIEHFHWVGEYGCVL